MESDRGPATDAAVLIGSLRLLHRAEAMGFDTDPAQPIDARLRTLVEDLARGGVGTEMATSLLASLSGQVAGADATLDVLAGLCAALAENPVPDREWRSLLDYFEGGQLAALLGISESSVNRYASNVRSTPDHIADRLHWLALVVGYLSGTYNEYGIRRWFRRTRAALGDLSPLDALRAETDWTPDAAAARSIERLARASTGMTVT